ncbi:Vacuolar protein sorting-associated protein 26B-A [Termitomyces sp. Mi166|nr:Vacuolar protein sorting-associated protein 26B-A [Termitomyces sp. Mi166\
MADVAKEKDIWVHSFRMPPDSNNAIKMEVGIEDCLHIEFEYNKSKYHLKDVIVGKIYFLLVRIKIKHMELSIIRRETTGAPPNQYNESETITKFEIMDGAPVRGETIPIRLFLGGFDLTPTFRDVNKKFSTRYYLNLVLIDEENRRYFKQQHLNDSLYRRLRYFGYPRFVALPNVLNEMLTERTLYFAFPVTMLRKLLLQLWSMVDHGAQFGLTQFISVGSKNRPENAVNTLRHQHAL